MKLRKISQAQLQTLSQAAFNVLGPRAQVSRILKKEVRRRRRQQGKVCRSTIVANSKTVRLRCRCQQDAGHSGWHHARLELERAGKPNKQLGLWWE